MDAQGGNNYTLTGTQQLLSVPYALYAKTAFDLDPNPTNELQVLSISNDTIFLTNGGFVKLPAGFDGQYSSLTGAPTNVSAFTNDAGYLTSEVDSSVTNEIQTLSFSNDTIFLTPNGGFVVLDTNASIDSDNQILSISGDSLSISGGNTVILHNPIFVAVTDSLYDGNKGGYIGANSLCNSKFPGSHMCTVQEIRSTINSGNQITTTDDFWISAGIPSTSPPPTNDCFGWTDPSSSSSAIRWVPDPITGGGAYSTPCNLVRKIGCCK